jgi:hypothetical protein
MTALDEQVDGTHYLDMPIQPIVFCSINNLGSHQTKIIKYVCRYKKKAGLKDLRKAKDMIQKLIEHEEIIEEVKTSDTCESCFGKHVVAKTFGYESLNCPCDCHNEGKLVKIKGSCDDCLYKHLEVASLCCSHLKCKCKCHKETKDEQ